MQLTDTEIKRFLDDNFLLETDTAEVLYHEYAASQPIIDYHNHLPPSEVTQNNSFDNLTEIWLKGDHYKWRAMRTHGIAEKYITGEASDSDKFLQWAATVPYTMRNPLFHWTHLELKRYFGIEDLLNPANAPRIYEECNELLQMPQYTTQSLLRKMQVEVLCTTDDPVDDLKYHKDFTQQNAGFSMLPAFRPDKAILIESPGFVDYIKALGNAAQIEIRSFQDVIDALSNRIAFFDAQGCMLSDHGLEQVYADEYSEAEVQRMFLQRMSGNAVSSSDARKYMSAVLYHLGTMYASRGWIQQFHLGALRDTNTRMRNTLGPNTGFDSIGGYPQAYSLAGFLDRLDSENQLAKTILYNVNPTDNEILATMVGNFNDGSVRGKLQFGAAWWYLDQKDGMERQLNALSNMSLLSCFIGMLTDSRSFLSFPRHEYFRRILCNLIGRDVHNGELPNDTAWLGGIVQDICYRNAKEYLGVGA